MSYLKCKMCGGTLEVTGNNNIATCEYCGTTQTIPTLDNDKKNLLHNRANTFRLKNEFDKALLTYENIVEEFTNDSEAYWGLVLCKYGIEYVDDPKTGIKIPTCHRTKTKSIFDDIDYQNAIKYSDVIARNIMITEAKEIDRLQKEILVLSQKEEPYDIFICYKETDESGKRTIDSVIAQDIYDELTRKGYKVFFARITLESKLGREYEPIIYAALTSSKAMLVIGTKPEYFNAVWVKNEWARFIDMMGESDNQKYLIPCYKDIDAYDLPEELVSYQCQDLNKLGYMQDLTRGLDKIFDKNISSIVDNSDYSIPKIVPSTSNMFARVDMLLSQNEFKKAEYVVEDILNENYRNAKAYIYLLLIELNLKNISDLEKHDIPLTNYSNYKNAYNFATLEFKKELDEINNKVINNIKQIQKEDIYVEAMKNFQRKRYSHALKLFRHIINYKDTDEYIKICEDIITTRRDRLYNDMIKSAELENYQEAIDLCNLLSEYENTEEYVKQYEKLMKQKETYFYATNAAALETVEGYKIAIKSLNEIKDYKNSEHLIKSYVESLRGMLEKEKKQKKKVVKKVKISLISVIVSIVLLVLLFAVIIPTTQYNKAINLVNNKEFNLATNILKKLNGYGSSENQFGIINAYKNFDNLNYKEGIEDIENIGGKVIINYDTDGGRLIEEKGNMVALKDDYTFYEWVQTGYEIINKKDEYQVTVDLKAFWKKSYYIKYDLDGGYSENLVKVYTKVDEVILPEPVKNGYFFLGWFDENDNEVETSDIQNMECKNYKLKAKWSIYKIENGYLYFGSYPKAKVEDINLLKELNDIPVVNEQGYIEHKGKMYKQFVYNYYLVEPIKWKILESKNGTYKLMSCEILDICEYYGDYEDRTIQGEKIYASNYKYSTVRAYLNGYNGTNYNVADFTKDGFIDVAFTKEHQEMILTTLVDNSSKTTESESNKYVCENTNDKVYLLSYQDIKQNSLNEEYERMLRITDFAASKNVNQINYFGTYYLRSPHYEYTKLIYTIDSYGKVLQKYTYDSLYGVAPCITISIDK